VLSGFTANSGDVLPHEATASTDAGHPVVISTRNPVRPSTALVLLTAVDATEVSAPVTGGAAVSATTVACNADVSVSWGVCPA